MNKKIPEPVRNGVAKVPVFLQMEALECGAACLNMILAYYGKWLPAEHVRFDCGVSRDGSNAKNLLKAARNYGLTASGYRYEPEELKKEGSFPCIVHWNFNHFVVCDGFKGDKVYLNDPARGFIKVPLAEFDRFFTGVSLMMEPSESFEPGGKRKSVLAFAAKRLQGSKQAVIFVALTTAISYLFSIINPAMSQVFVDRFLSGRNPEWLLPFIGLMAGLCFLQILVKIVIALYSLKINGKMAVVGSSSYMWKLLKLPMEFFSQRMIGDIVARKDTNESIAQTLVNVLAPLFLNGVMLVFYLIVMARKSLLLTAIGIITLLVNLLVSEYISEKRVNMMRLQLRDAGNLASTAVNGISMIETIKSSGAENAYFRKWARYQASMNAQSVKYTTSNAYLGLIPSIVSMLADDAVLFIGVLMTMKGSFTLGSMLMFQGLLNSFMAPAMNLVNAGQTLQEMRNDMDRIEDVMNYPDDPYVKDEKIDENKSYGKLSGKIEIKNVTFGYSRLAEPLIRDFSMTINPGSRVAFVGGSGCGKSTLAKLITGMQKPWSGEILFDGKPIDQIDRSVFTGSVALVDQQIVLFEDTVSENIKLWDESIEDFEMILAARDARIHDVIMQRKGGYQHKLIEGGKDFSGGERQRIEIARALAQDPSIIILDEATSALDAKVEYEVVKAIKERGITCIVIAHRLSTIRDCDEIVVLDHGNVVERGTHKQLYANGAYYTQLIESE